MSLIILGIESTAHTAGVGIITSEGKILSNQRSVYIPEKGAGIHPREAANHHSENLPKLFKKAFEEANISSDDISLVSYARGPGLGPCLRTGATAARAFAYSNDIPLLGVNHCVAHIEVGRNQTGCIDPVLLYVSGGNTQVIARADGRYRVLGETLDIGIGNMLDKFARNQGMPFPGGPKIEQLALEHSKNDPQSLDEAYLPYGVHGMDLAFSGMLTSATQKISEGLSLEKVCWSLQEHSFATCVEVAERALAHTGKTELLLGGGVACNDRLREMSKIMCDERGANCFWPEKPFCIDNGTMIAELGRRMLECGIETQIMDSAIDPSLRTDNTAVVWE